MKKEDIRLDDVQRILFGEAPPAFLLEVLVRTIVIYIALLIAIRIMGKRTNGEVTVTEVAIVIMLGAVVSVPMQVPDRGILQGLLVLFAIVGYQRGLTWLSLKSRKIELFTQGSLSILIKDGVLQNDVLREARISRQQLFSLARTRKVFNLGRIERLYLEANGEFSLYCLTDSRPGLPIYPPDDRQILMAQEPVHGMIACHNCGTVIAGPETDCPNCSHREWIQATIEHESQ